MMLKGPKIPNDKSVSFKLGYWSMGCVLALALGSAVIGLMIAITWMVQTLAGMWS